MTRLRHVIYIISDILSFSEDRNQLIQDLRHPKINWEQFVKIGSQHLVLPAIYCRLEQKKLLNYLPEDLKEYLESITDVNRNRNATIINEAKSLYKLLEQHGIQCVFLKGTAMLLSDSYYNDIAERMIGDIDILIHESDIEEVKKIITNEGYEFSKPNLHLKYFNTKHLPRCTSKNKIAALEIHTNLLSNVSYLEPTDVFNNTIEHCNIILPNRTILLRHNIYNFQINDHGFYYQNPNLRSYYDTCILINQKTSYAHFKDLDRINKRYFKIGSTFLRDFLPIVDNENINNFWLKVRLRYSCFQFLWMKTLNGFKYCLTLSKRLKYFILNKNYREDIVNQLFKQYNR